MYLSLPGEKTKGKDPVAMKYPRILFSLFAAALLVGKLEAFQPISSNFAPRSLSTAVVHASTTGESTWFGGTSTATDATRDAVKDLSLEQLKAQILQLGAALDRGQAYNPTSGSYYESSMEAAKDRIQALVDNHPKPAITLADMEGEWELVLTTGA